MGQKSELPQPKNLTVRKGCALLCAIQMQDMRQNQKLVICSNLNIGNVVYAGHARAYTILRPTVFAMSSSLAPYP